MFIIKDKKEYIMAFMTGYEIGKESNLLTELSTFLEEKYKYPKIPKGWSGQIDVFSNETGLSWESSFNRIMLETLMEDMDSSEESKTKGLIKSIIRSKIAHLSPKVFNIEKNGIKINKWSGKEWINKWLGLVDIDQNWFRNYWNKEELSVIEKIDIEVKILYEELVEKSINLPSKELISLSKKFFEVTNGA